MMKNIAAQKNDAGSERTNSGYVRNTRPGPDLKQSGWRGWFHNIHTMACLVLPCCDYGYEQDAVASFWSFDFFLFIEVCLHLCQLSVCHKKSYDKQSTSHKLSQPSWWLISDSSLFAGETPSVMKSWYHDSNLLKVHNPLNFNFYLSISFCIFMLLFICINSQSDEVD